uniref:Uncharacterized protein n=1 Tax=Helianthus annuus TaxID=4232 RepID=A0A251VKF9_HELAN
MTHIKHFGPAVLLGEEVTEFVVTRNVMVFRGGGIMVIWKMKICCKINLIA